MLRGFISIFFVLGALPVHGQTRNSEYYAAIQLGTASVSAEQFADLEANALVEFASASVYPPLINAFSTTTERVWAVIYGEVFVNLSEDDKLQSEIGSLVFQLYDDAIIQKSPSDVSVSLTRQSEMDPGNPQLPFSMNFEMSIIYGLLLQGPPGSARGFRPGLDPLTLQALADIRRAQLAMWGEKSLPPTELIQWQRRVEQAGHLETYNYWLFRSARPAEFEEWRLSHIAEYEAWHEWHRANRMSPAAPDFQRLHLRPGAVNGRSVGRRLGPKAHSRAKRGFARSPGTLASLPHRPHGNPSWNLHCATPNETSGRLFATA